MGSNAIKPGQCWRSDSLGTAVEVVAVPPGKPLRVRYLSPSWAAATGPCEMTRKWLRKCYSLALSPDETAGEREAEGEKRPDERDAT